MLTIGLFADDDLEILAPGAVVGADRAPGVERCAELGAAAVEKLEPGAEQAGMAGDPHVAFDPDQLLADQARKSLAAVGRVGRLDEILRLDRIAQGIERYARLELLVAVAQADDSVG